MSPIWQRQLPTCAGGDGEGSAACQSGVTAQRGILGCRQGSVLTFLDSRGPLG